MTANPATAQDEVVDICRDLLRIDTSNPGDHSGPGERAAAEHVAAGGVYDQDQTVSSLVARFASLQAESYRASESLRAIERLGQTWQSGASPLTQAVTAGTA